METLIVGTRVAVTTGKEPENVGIVRFIGQTKFAEGDWYGVELDTPTGKNDGAVQGVQYFDCQPRHGIFVKKKTLRVLSATMHKSQEGITKQPSQQDRPADEKSGEKKAQAASPAARQAANRGSVGSIASRLDVPATSKGPSSLSPSSARKGSKEHSGQAPRSGRNRRRTIDETNLPGGSIRDHAMAARTAAAAADSHHDREESEDALTALAKTVDEGTLGILDFWKKVTATGTGAMHNSGHGHDDDQQSRHQHDGGGSTGKHRNNGNSNSGSQQHHHHNTSSGNNPSSAHTASSKATSGNRDGGDGTGTLNPLQNIRDAVQKVINAPNLVKGQPPSQKRGRGGGQSDSSDTSDSESEDRDAMSGPPTIGAFRDVAKKAVLEGTRGLFESVLQFHKALSDQSREIKSLRGTIEGLRHELATKTAAFVPLDRPPGTPQSHGQRRSSNASTWSYRSPTQGSHGSIHKGSHTTNNNNTNNSNSNFSSFAPRASVIGTAVAAVEQANALTSSQWVQIKGASGKNGARINGRYRPTPEVIGERTAFEKDGDSDTWCCFDASHGRWKVQRAAAKGSERGWLYSPRTASATPVLEGPWTVWTGDGWQVQPMVSIVVTQADPEALTTTTTGPSSSSSDPSSSQPLSPAGQRSARRSSVGMAITATPSARPPRTDPLRIEEGDEENPDSHPPAGLAGRAPDCATSATNNDSTSHSNNNNKHNNSDSSNNNHNNSSTPSGSVAPPMDPAQLRHDIETTTRPYLARFFARYARQILEKEPPGQAEG